MVKEIIDETKCGLLDSGLVFDNEVDLSIWTPRSQPLLKKISNEVAPMKISRFKLGLRDQYVSSKVGK